MMVFRRTLATDQRYLALPVRPSAEGRHQFLSLYEGDSLLYEVFLDIDLNDPAFYAFLDLARFKGKTLTAVIEGEGLDERILEHLIARDDYPGRENLYREPRRSHLHFSAARGYISDPNGLFHYDGVYHMFYQHDPFNMGFVDWKNYVNFGWGHAVSRDLIHWEECPDPLLPDERGPIFSGSGLVDTKNVSGLQTGEHPPILLYYTAAGGQGRRSRHLKHEQCLAVSLDGGRTFEKFDKNPIVPNKAIGNRDPKVFYHPSLQKWMMVVYTDDGEKYLMYTGDDLLHFDYLCDFKWDNMECPDLLQLEPVERPGEKVMVLWGANGSYVPVGFDGNAFYPLCKAKKLQSAFLYSCAQTFNNAPDGRCIQLAVYRMCAGRVSSGCMTIPHELKLHRDADGDYYIEPVLVEEAACLRMDARRFPALDTRETIALPTAPLLEMEIDFPLQETAFVLNGLEWKFHLEARTMEVNGEAIPLAHSDHMRLRILMDGSTVQAYEPLNRVFLEFGFLAQNAELLFPKGVKADSLTLYPLKSIWET